MPSKSTLTLLGMALFSMGITIAFLLGRDFKIIYMAIAYIGFALLAIGFFIHAGDMFGKDENSTKNHKQPWE